MNAAKYLLNNGASPKKVAMLTKQGDFTYGDIRTGTAGVAAHLQENGLQKGDRGILIAESSFFWAVSYLGTMAAGGVSVPLPSNIGHKELSYFIQETGASWLMTRNRLLHKLAEGVPHGVNILLDHNAGTLGGVHEGATGIDDILAKPSLNALHFREVNPQEDLAAIMFTSGSTGKPRGVMVNHRNIIANTDSILQYLELTEKDRIMAVLPFCYCFGISLLHTHLKVGGSVVVEPSFLYPEMILNRMQATGCTGIAGVPSTFQLLLRKSTLKKRIFPHLRSIQQAGGKLSNPLIRQLRQALPGTSIFIMYGQTEATARLSYLDPGLLDSKAGSVGVGIPGVTLTVVKKDGSPVCPGEVGEIIAQGENVTLGYWNDPIATSETFQDGSLHTGDMAVVDKDGFITIVDREKEFLKCAGRRVSYRQIEDVVLGFPGMVEAAVIAQESEYLGETVRLYVVHPDGERIKSQLERHCGRNLEWPFIPRTIIFRESLPMTSSGKLDKSVL